MNNKYLDLIKRIVTEELKNENVKIGLFGSFANGTNTYASDIGVAVIPYDSINKWKLAEIREKLDDTTIPYIIDIVDFSMVSESFKNTALQNMMWWRD